MILIVYTRNLHVFKVLLDQLFIKINDKMPERKPLVSVSAGPGWSGPCNQRNASNSDKTLKGEKGTTVSRAGKGKRQMEDVKQP